MDHAFHIDPTDPMPLYAQLERAIRFAVTTGAVRVGDRLPTVRQLAVELRINANTVARVYAELERAGVVETRRGSGTFVRDQPAIPMARSTEALRRLADRFLAEAARLGYSLDEAIEAVTMCGRDDASDARRKE